MSATAIASVGEVTKVRRHDEVGCHFDTASGADLDEQTKLRRHAERRHLATARGAVAEMCDPSS